MKSLRTAISFVLVLLLGSAALAQDEDWDAVRSLPPETHIVVKLKHKRGVTDCWVQRVTEDSLTCEREDRTPHLATFGRGEIQKIYEKPDPHRERPTVAPFSIIPAAVVSVILVSVFAGAPAGLAMSGGIVGIALLVRYFNHGELIYRSRDRDPTRAAKIPPGGMS